MYTPEGLKSDELTSFMKKVGYYQEACCTSDFGVNLPVLTHFFKKKFCELFAFKSVHSQRTDFNEVCHSSNQKLMSTNLRGISRYNIGTWSYGHSYRRTMLICRFCCRNTWCCAFISTLVYISHLFLRILGWSIMVEICVAL